MIESLESAYKVKMVKAIKDAGGYARRIEDQYGVGILDMILCLPTTGMICAEAKRFKGNFFKPSPRQYVEMERINNGGGLSLLIGIKEGVHYLHHSTMTAFVDNCVVQQNGESFPDLLMRWYNIQGKK